MLDTVLKSCVVTIGVAFAPAIVSTKGAPVRLVPVTVQEMPLSLPPELMLIRRGASRIATPPETTLPLRRTAPAPGDWDRQILFISPCAMLRPVFLIGIL